MSAVDIKLEELPHQAEAVQSTLDVFSGVRVIAARDKESNPNIVLDRKTIEENVADIQKGEGTIKKAIAPEHRRSLREDYLGIDIHMETGTGKTYTYTRTMFEMNRLLGVSKFIVVVPSVAIKRGTVDFLTASYVRRHFKDKYGNVELRVHVVEPRSGKLLAMPQAVSDYYNGSTQDKKIIHVLVVNSGMLKTNETSALNRSDYDGTLGGVFTRPYDAIRHTKPVVIIDEPHKFKRSGTTFKVITEQLKPQVLIRYGATYPYAKTPTKKNPEPPRDFDNLVYSLGSLESFNKGLVKGVDVRTPSTFSENALEFRLMSVTGTSKSGHKALFREQKHGEPTGREIEIDKNDELSVLSPEFRGLKVVKFDTGSSGRPGSVELSNDHIIQATAKDTLINELFSTSYQEVMLHQAVVQHFEQEEELFARTTKIKPLTLFFIDSVHSYRDTSSGLTKPGHLAVAFERILKSELDEQIAEYKSKPNPTKNNLLYIEYLEATRADLSATHGGYFSKDNSSKDVDIEREVQLILNGKRELMSFKKDDGSWNTMRFVFSKWTLKEGWDNPNIFQIVKLRSSGSEISKLQEVGRGLRLPVDESGNRISRETFHLTYFVDYSEREFAKQLKEEILRSASLNNVNDNGMIHTVAEFRGVDSDHLFLEMLTKRLITMKGDINEETRATFLATYPEFDSLLKHGAIIDNTGDGSGGGSGSGDSGDGKRSGRVAIRKPLYKELKALWESLNFKYIIEFDEVDDDVLDEAMDYMLDKTSKGQKSYVITSTRTYIDKFGRFSTQDGVANDFNLDSVIPYGDFIKRISKTTHLPINTIHRGIVRFNEDNPVSDEFFTSRRLTELSTAFYDWFKESFLSRYQYKRIDAPVGSTLLTDVNGEPLDSISQGYVGTILDENKQVPDTFLYDKFVHDKSTLEAENIENTNSSSVKSDVAVFAKIPSKSIRIPHYFGGTTTPDFMYVLTDTNGQPSINFVVESKSYAHDDQMPETDKAIGRTAQKYFDDFNEQADVDVKFYFQTKTQSIIDIIRESLM